MRTDIPQIAHRGAVMSHIPTGLLMVTYAAEPRSVYTDHEAQPTRTRTRSYLSYCCFSCALSYKCFYHDHLKQRSWEPCSMITAGTSNAVLAREENVALEDPGQPIRSNFSMRKLINALSWALAAGLLFAIAPALPAGATDALFIFYQPMLPMLLMLWLWTLVVSFFEAYYIRYDACFAAEHLKFLLSADALATLAESFTTLMAVSVSAYIMLASNGYFLLASLQPGLFFVAIAIFLANPLDFTHDTTYGAQRWFFLETLRRVVLPFQTVHFTDFLLADIMTSLAKPFADLAIAACHLTSRRSVAESLVNGFSEDVCGNSSAFVPYVLALPYVWRFFQCLLVAHAHNDRGQVLNAIKYTTAIPVVFLNFVKYTAPKHAWRRFWKPLWLVSAFVNTSYSFYWDVERDWDIRLFTPGAKQLLKSSTRMFQNSALYFTLIGVNLVLRISWTYKLNSDLRNMKWFVLVMTLLEVFRRFLWSFVRIENELRKIEGKQPALGPLIPQPQQQLLVREKKKSSAYMEPDDRSSSSHSEQEI
eukprot:jgi/Ulvmu1/7773/UM004_0002.1